MGNKLSRDNLIANNYYQVKVTRDTRLCPIFAPDNIYHALTQRGTEDGLYNGTQPHERLGWQAFTINDKPIFGDFIFFPKDRQLRPKMTNDELVSYTNALYEVRNSEKYLLAWVEGTKHDAVTSHDPYFFFRAEYHNDILSITLPLSNFDSLNHWFESDVNEIMRSQSRDLISREAYSYSFPSRRAYHRSQFEPRSSSTALSQRDLTSLLSKNALEWFGKIKDLKSGQFESDFLERFFDESTTSSNGTGKNETLPLNILSLSSQYHTHPPTLPLDHFHSFGYTNITMHTTSFFPTYGFEFEGTALKWSLNEPLGYVLLIFDPTIEEGRRIFTQFLQQIIQLRHYGCVYDTFNLPIYMFHILNPHLDRGDDLYQFCDPHSHDTMNNNDDIENNINNDNHDFENNINTDNNDNHDNNDLKITLDNSKATSTDSTNLPQFLNQFRNDLPSDDIELIKKCNIQSSIDIDFTQPLPKEYFAEILRLYGFTNIITGTFITHDDFYESYQGLSETIRSTVGKFFPQSLPLSSDQSPFHGILDHHISDTYQQMIEKENTLPENVQALEKRKQMSSQQHDKNHNNINDNDNNENYQYKDIYNSLHHFYQKKLSSFYQNCNNNSTKNLDGGINVLMNTVNNTEANFRYFFSRPTLHHSLTYHYVFKFIARSAMKHLYRHHLDQLRVGGRGDNQMVIQTPQKINFSPFFQYNYPVFSPFEFYPTPFHLPRVDFDINSISSTLYFSKAPQKNSGVNGADGVKAIDDILIHYDDLMVIKTNGVSPVFKIEISHPKNPTIDDFYRLGRQTRANLADFTLTRPSKAFLNEHGFTLNNGNTEEGSSLANNNATSLEIDNSQIPNELQQEQHTYGVSTPCQKSPHNNQHQLQSQYTTYINHVDPTRPKDSFKLGSIRRDRLHYDIKNATNENRPKNQNYSLSENQDQSGGIKKKVKKNAPNYRQFFPTATPQQSLCKILFIPVILNPFADYGDVGNIVKLLNISPGSHSGGLQGSLGLSEDDPDFLKPFLMDQHPVYCVIIVLNEAPYSRDFMRQLYLSTLSSSPAPSIHGMMQNVRDKKIRKRIEAFAKGWVLTKNEFQQCLLDEWLDQSQYHNDGVCGNGVDWRQEGTIWEDGKGDDEQSHSGHGLVTQSDPPKSHSDHSSATESSPQSVLKNFKIFHSREIYRDEVKETTIEFNFDRKRLGLVQEELITSVKRSIQSLIGFYYDKDSLDKAAEFGKRLISSEESLKNEKYEQNHKEIGVKKNNGSIDDNPLSRHPNHHLNTLSQQSQIDLVSNPLDLWTFNMIWRDQIDEFLEVLRKDALMRRLEAMWRRGSV